jgi:hypothetical protein
VVELEHAVTAAALAKRIAARVSGRLDGIARPAALAGTSPPQNGQAADPTLT